MNVPGADSGAAEQADGRTDGDPYPGLRPFLPEEADIFFGREQMADEVLVRLNERHMVVVHGASGCGKSSLVSAGVLPQLARRRARRGLTLRVGTFRPGSRPMQSLVATIASLVAGGTAPEQVQIVYAAIAQRQGARDALARVAKAAGVDQLCIVVDQFEELFRFAEDESFEEAQRFAEVLVSLAGAIDRPTDWWDDSEADDGTPRAEGTEAQISFLLTMRSEFLGDCSRYPGLAHAINRTQYLLPNMERSDLVRAIREPAAVFGGTVEHSLAERIADDAAAEQDSLPLVQHALMKLWRAADDSHALCLARYEDAIAASGQPAALRQKSPLGAILAGHADAVLDSVTLGDAERTAAAGHVFRALTRKDTEGRAIRCPQRFGRLEAVSGVAPGVTREIVDSFRREGVSFLTPYEAMQPDIDGATVIDISHEALIRTWPRMSDRTIDPKDAQPIGWLEREAQEAMVWRWLVLHAEHFRGNSSAYLDGTTTDRLGAWFETLAHRPEWVRPYLLHGEGKPDVRHEKEWKAVATLLEESKRKTWLERNMVRRWKKLGRWSLVLLALAIGALIFGGLSWYSRAQQDLAAHRQFEARRDIATALYVTQNIVRERSAKRIVNSNSLKDELIPLNVARAASPSGSHALLLTEGNTAHIWIGRSRGDTIVSTLALPGGQSVRPDQVAPNQTYRVRENLILRRDRPGPGYTPDEATGIITAGATIRATAAPIAVPGNGGTDYWLPVALASSPMPRVTIDFLDDRSAAVEMAARLGRSGYPVSTAQTTGAAGEPRVHYCGSGNLPAATALAYAATIQLSHLAGYEATTAVPVEDCSRASSGLTLVIDNPQLD